MIPLTGVPLPFLSYGGSYTICLMIAMGLVQRVAIESKKNTNKTKAQSFFRYLGKKQNKKCIYI